MLLKIAKLMKKANEGKGAAIYISTFEKLLKNKKVKNYIDDRKPKKETLTNLKVTILYINHDYETRDGLSSSLVALWEDLFKYIGVENYEIIKQLDIK